MALGNLQEIIPAFFTGAKGERLTPEQIAQRQIIAQSLMEKASDTSPNAGGIASILTKGLQGYQAGRDRRLSDKATQTNAAASEANMTSMLGALTGGNSYNQPIQAGVSPTPSSIASAPSSPMAIPSAPEIREGLISRGLPPHVADAFVVNFNDESGMNPGINEKKPLVAGSRGGFGLYQLTGPRRREYEAFAAQRGVDPSDTNAQLDFLMLEGSGKEKAAFDKILASPDTATAAQAIVNEFLRPSMEHRKSRSARYAGLPMSPAGEERPIQVASTDPNFMPQAVTGEPLLSAGVNVQPQENAIASQSLSQPQASPVAQQVAQSQPMQVPQTQQAGINPAVLSALSSPYSSPQERKVAELLLGQHMQQQQAQQAQAQTLAQRQQAASSLGINPAMVGADEHTWKAMVDQATRNRNTVTVGNTVYDANTGQQIIQGNASPTTDIQNYEYARQNGYGGSFADYQQEVKRAGATNISNVLGGEGMPGLGKLSTDYTYVMDPATRMPTLNERGLPTAVPVPGSAADVARQKEVEAAARQTTLTERQLNPTIDDIATARDLATKTGTLGQMAPILKNIPLIGQNAENMAATIDAIGSGISLENLNQMRQASPTGGALGNVSDKQSALLSEAFGSLRQSMSRELFLYNLARVENVLNDIVHGSGNGPDRNDLGALRSELNLGKSGSDNQKSSRNSNGNKTKSGVSWSVN